MDKLDRELRRLTPKEKIQIKKILQQLAANNFSGLNIVKLKSRDNIYRVRKGDLRIIYRITKEKNFILAIERRSEKTYRDY